MRCILRLMKSMPRAEIEDLFLFRISLRQIELTDTDLSSDIKALEVLFTDIIRSVDMVGLASLNLREEPNLWIEVKRRCRGRGGDEQARLHAQNRLRTKAAWNTTELLNQHVSQCAESIIMIFQTLE